MRQYGNKRRTKKEVATAALMLSVLSNRTREEKIDALVRSYGKTREQAERMVGE